MTAVRNMTVYKDSSYYSAFPSVAMLNSGELMVLFYRAPQRKPYSFHLDSESAAVLVRSRDNGHSWSQPELVYKGEFAVQDPSIALLTDGTLISNFFQWKVVKEEPFNHSVQGTFILRSFNNGLSWQDIVNVDLPDYEWQEWVATSEPVLELPSGELLLPLYDRCTSFIARSNDRGYSWQSVSVIARDQMNNLTFCEPTLCMTMSGRIICMLREESAYPVYKGNYLFQSDSLDGGKTWSTPRKTNIWGHPGNLLTLSDGRILVTYGYRRPPWGIRGCISEDEGKTWNLREEIVLRTDGLHADLGYPSSVEIMPGKIFTVYYFHTGDAVHEGSYRHYSENNGVRYIAGSLYDV